MKKTTRVQLELPDEAMERLKSMRELSEAASYAEVIRNALRLYETLVLEERSGSQLFLSVLKDGVETRAKVFI
jgi:Arc/MetJ-type ribon-helix-helix transcriptional regulator